jgi:antirestriction protein
LPVDFAACFDAFRSLHDKLFVYIACHADRNRQTLKGKKMLDTKTTTPRIYVACLASYNNGILHGRWIEATTDVDDMAEQIADMLKASPSPDAEEYAFHDHEGLGDLGEYDGLEVVARRVAIAEAADGANMPASVLLAAMGDLADDDTDPEEFISDRYRGEYDDWSDFVQEMVEETHDMNALPDWVRNHIDWESMAWDWQCSGDFSEFDGHFFWAH